MKLIGLMPVRNEDWCLGLTARAALQWCDELVLRFHACTDQSFEIGKELCRENFTGRVCLINDTDPTWHEMDHRQNMLNWARLKKATHIATIDADEIISANLLVHRDSLDCACIRCCVKAVSPGEIFALPWLAIRKYRMPYVEAGAVHGQFGYINDTIDAHTTLAFEDSPRFHWEARDGYDFHRRHPFYKGGKDFFRGGLTKDEGGVMHLQFLSNRRLRAKQALYQMTEVLRWPNRAFGISYNSQAEANAALARGYGKTTYRPFNASTLPCPDSWWAPYADLLKHLNIDGVPWQEIECKKLWAEHGVEKFKGLDLFGVVS